MKHNQGLPKGIWYESRESEGRKPRYRVRLYRNKVAYRGGYHNTLEEALAALDELKNRLQQIPKLPRQRRGNKRSAPVPKGNLSGTVSALRTRRMFDPDILKRRRMA